MFESENEVMSANKVADALHIGLNTVYRLIKENKLSAFRTGTRSWHIPRIALEQYIKESIHKK